VSGAALEIEDVRAGFGSRTVLHGVSLEVAPGEVVALLGLNGAGKSVTIKVAAGVVPAWNGRVRLNGVEVTRARAEARVARGMGHVPQGRMLFPELTVAENLRLGGYTLRRRDRARYAERAETLLTRFPVLGRRQDQRASTLSGGEQAMLCLARALVNEPTVVLVDEPTAGLAPLVVDGLKGLLREVKEAGVAILLVEQHVRFALDVADQVHVMQSGRIVHSAPAAKLTDKVLATHLGIGTLLRRRSRSRKKEDEKQ
jgi:branched-chain amino acid transport system ATP-binding protein